MIIEEKIKNKLLNWNDTDPIYKQFEKKCATLSKISGLIINPEEYQLQYQLHESAIDSYMDLQKELYEVLYEKYPNLEFGMSGRLKSPYSHYEKVIRKFVELFQKDEFKPVEILDDYAIKIFLLYINYPIDKISIDTEGIYIDSGANEFRIDDTDCFEFLQEDKILKVNVEKGAHNIWVDNATPYIYTTRNGKELTFPLSNAITYKKSSRESLVEYCRDFQKDVENFYNMKGFATKKRKDYISQPKPSGYASRQCSFYSEEQDLGIECQIRTYDMERFNNEEREYGYKPNEHKISSNSLNTVPHFVLTTKTADGVENYPMTNSECFKYIFGISLQEYRKQMKPVLALKEEKKKENYKHKEREDGAR